MALPMHPIMPRPARPEHIGWSEWALLAETLATLAIASLAVRLIPFKRLVAFLSDWPSSQTATPALLPRLRWAVDAAARRVPWRAVCFQQGVTFHLMLRRRGIGSTIHYGICRDGDEGIKAHVWLSVADEIVIGGEAARDYTCVASFAPGPEKS